MTVWRITDADDTTLLAPVLHPWRWDVGVERSWESAPITVRQRRRLARQVRQDMWRAVRHVRGFLPMVAVTARLGEVTIRAGGTLVTRSGHRPTMEAAIGRVLDSRMNRMRWLSYALG